MDASQFKDVEIQPGGESNGREKHISLKTDGKNLLLLSWELPITEAHLIMVDECILRIDASTNSSLSKFYCFPVGFNYSPLLKLGRWNNKRLTKPMPGVTRYDFSDKQIEHDFEITQKPVYIPIIDTSNTPALPLKVVTNQDMKIPPFKSWDQIMMEIETVSQNDFILQTVFDHLKKNYNPPAGIVTY